MTRGVKSIPLISFSEVNSPSPTQTKSHSPKMSTCPSGVSGMMRMMVKGMKASTSRAVRRRASTSRGLSVPPARGEEERGT